MQFLEPKLIEKDSDLVCKKHQQKIAFIILDRQLQSDKRLLCRSCSKRNPNNAKIVDYEQLKQKFDRQQREKIQFYYQIIQPHIKEIEKIYLSIDALKTKIFQRIELLANFSKDWISDLNNSIIEYSFLKELDSLIQKQPPLIDPKIIIEKIKIIKTHRQNQMKPAMGKFKNSTEFQLFEQTIQFLHYLIQNQEIDINQEQARIQSMYEVEQINDQQDFQQGLVDLQDFELFFTNIIQQQEQEHNQDFLGILSTNFNNLNTQSYSLDQSEYFNQADSVHSMKDYEEALKYYNSEIKKTPNNSYNYYNKGKNALYSLNSNNFNKIEQILRGIRKLYDSNFERTRKIRILQLQRYKLILHLLTGNALTKMYRFEEALRDYDLAIQRNFENSDYFYCKAITLRKMNRFQEALEHFDLAIQRDPQNSDYYHSKAITLTKMNRFEEALNNFDLAIQKNPENSYNYFCKAITLTKMNRFQEALQYCDLAILRDRKNSMNYNCKGNVLMKMKRFEEALESYEKAIHRNPENSLNNFCKATALTNMNRFEEALQNYDYAIQKNPENSYIYYQKAITLRKLNRFEEALEKLGYANLEKSRKFIQLLLERQMYFTNWIAITLRKLNRFEEALENYDYAIQRNPESSYNYCQKAITLTNMNRFEEALENYDYAIQKNPESSYNYFCKAITLTNMNRLEMALNNYDKAIYINPANPDYYNFKGNVLFKMKKLQESLSCFNLALNLNPLNSDYLYCKGSIFLHLQIARTLREMSRFEEALECYKLAIQQNPDNPDYYYSQCILFWFIFTQQQLQQIRIDLMKLMQFIININQIQVCPQFSICIAQPQATSLNQNQNQQNQRNNTLTPLPQ
ncbi:unnamed protein product (macronuclear) [Paramecium tetraurelia]|uniref:UDP-N-acetylglucosamine--peptide N-acetylglucosaminyltransferase SPINDLY n=1 Tax=Paramecium tetraurelia TaxID=5888 RepID=A0CZ84_PARTE|nr:uncharacterized protein GSPATT00011674001 [Paramecium tetraurelia]CAK76101.1 unnamed protein product [Paramecium tetraurelia]|eukprot:XP_001443498.1 hypothetical protein (macronuclear) [Paramecium tetraurelia strain d4-2]